MIPEDAVNEKENRDKKNQLDRRKVSEKSRQKLESAIEELEGSEAAVIRELAHIVTGDDRFEK